MRIFGRNVKWEARLLVGFVAAAVLGVTAHAWSAQSLILTNANSTNATARAANYIYSPGLADILRMVNAKVDPEVVKAFIKASSVPYSPSAAEVVALKNQGVPSDVLTALLQRGAELRTQMAQAPTAPPGQTPYPGYPGAGAQAAVPSPYDYGMGYGPYPADYGYGYPSYWWYNSYWPWYSSWWPGFGFGFDSFNHHHHFDNFRNPRFQNDDFNRFRSARFQNFDFNRFNQAQFQNIGVNGFNRFNNGFNRFNSPFSPVIGFNRFNNGATVPRAGMTVFGVPSRAYAPGAFAGGLGTPVSTGAGRPGFAVRSFGGGFRGGMGGRGGGGGGHGGGGGGHR